MRSFFIKGLVVFILLILTFLCVLVLTGCGITKTKATSKSETVASSTRDSSYSRRDSSGNTYTKETIREYYHDSTHTVYQPYPVYREIIREAGQSSNVSTDTGHYQAKDTTAAKSEAGNKTTEVEGLNWFNWVVLAALAFLLLKPIISRFQFK